MTKRPWPAGAGGTPALATWSLIAAACGTTAARAQTSFVGANFAGSNFNLSGYIPPDTMGAIGPDHFVELINGRYAVYNRSGTLVTSSSLNNFFTNAGASTSTSFDPRVAYDPNSGRWFAAAADNDGSASSSFLLAVSKTSDPTAGWSAFRIDADATNVSWADFPMMGFNRDAVVLSANLFPNSGSGSNYTELVVLPKSDLLLATPTVTHRTAFSNLDPNTTGYSAQPAVDRDGTFPSYLFSDFNTAAGFNKVSSLTGSATAPVLNTSGGFVTVPALGPPPAVDQPGSKPNLDGGDGRFATSVVMAGGNLWAVQGVDSGGRAAVHWLRVDPNTGTVVESGTISSPSLAYSFPSIAVNGQGGVVIGFTGTSSTTTYPSTYAVVGRTTGGVTTFGTPFQTQAGSSDYVLLDGSNTNRWGDYSNTTVDPTDPDVYWTIQEYVPATNTWATKVTEIIAPPPGQVRWKTGTGGTYATAANWLAGAAPTAASDVVFSNYNSTYTVTLSGGTTAASLAARRGSVTLSLGAGGSLNLTRTSSPALVVSDYYGNGALTLPSGTVTAQSATVGYASGGTGALNITGATLSLSGTLAVNNANSSVSISAGTLGAGTVSLAAGGTLNFNGGSLAANTISIPGGKLFVAANGNRTLRTTSLSISSGGTVDLNDNAAVIDYTGSSPFTTIRSYLATGYAGGNWNGAGGIDSTSAKNNPGKHRGLALAEASAVLGLSGSATKSWSGVTVDATSLLIDYTWYGDINLDGKLNADDYALMDRSFARHPAAGTGTWVTGDFNYDGSVTSADYLLMDAAFAVQTGGPSPALLAERQSEFGSDYVTALIAAVPEPASGLGAGLGGGLLLSRRARRRQRRQ